MTLKIKVSNNGPLLVQGDFTLIDHEGNEFTPKKSALCRCGGSTTKPYCDGTHSKTGFQGAMAAVEKEESGK